MPVRRPARRGRSHAQPPRARLVVDSPLGRLLVEADSEALRTVRFLRANEPVPPEDPADAAPARALAERGAAELSEYFAGSLREFTTPVAPEGTRFQQRVWRALRQIAYGTTRSYGDIARLIGRRRAARAVGAANHENPVAIVVPCHRVIGADRSLVGYGGGLERKEWLLRHEAEHAGTAPVEPPAAEPPPARKVAARAAAR
jgi:methylated-DNA-[protein]-cysteine S-methyltransferase